MSHRYCRCPGCSRIPQHCWYKRKEWRVVAAAVLRRDREECRIVPGCPKRARVADHINSVSRDTPWHEFIAMSGLRAGCTTHNTRRGMAERLMREMEHGSELTQPVGFFNGRGRRTGALPKSLSPRGYRPVVAGYGRASGDR